MKVAIIFSGHTRSFRHCLPTFKWHVGRHFKEAEIFFSTVNDADFQDALKCGFLDNIHWEQHESQPPFPIEGARGEWKKGAYFGHEPYPISVPPENVMRQLWQLEQGYKLYLRTTDEKDLAEIVIRVRPDLWFHSFEHCGGYNAPNECHTPWWGRFGGINDRFSIMGRDAADAYFFTFTKIEKLLAMGCPLHPESLVKASLEEAHCVIYPNLQAEFSTMRTDGIIRPPEISISDLAHAAMR